jgi:hypothetical protein
MMMIGRRPKFEEKKTIMTNHASQHSFMDVPIYRAFGKSRLRSAIKIVQESGRENLSQKFHFHGIVRKEKSQIIRRPSLPKHMPSSFLPF